MIFMFLFARADNAEKGAALARQMENLDLGHFWLNEPVRNANAMYT